MSKERLVTMRFPVETLRKIAELRNSKNGLVFNKEKMENHLIKTSLAALHGYTRTLKRTDSIDIARHFLDSAISAWVDNFDTALEQFHGALLALTGSELLLIIWVEFVEQEYTISFEVSQWK